jgi:hypothetical protein
MVSMKLSFQNAFSWHQKRLSRDLFVRSVFEILKFELEILYFEIWGRKKFCRWIL